MGGIFEFDNVTPESIKADAKREIRQRLEPQGLSVETREGSYTDILLDRKSTRLNSSHDN